MESFALVTAVGAVLAALAWHGRRSAPRAAVVVAFVAASTAAVAALWSSQDGPRRQAAAQLDRALPARVEDGGFVTSATCEPCHPSQYRSWHDSYHRTMTQVAGPDTVIAPFEGVSGTSRGHPVHLERRGDQFWADVVDPRWELAGPPPPSGDGVEARGAGEPPRVQRRVVMTTGLHHMQEYWISAGAGNLLYRVPLAYLREEHLPAERRWVPVDDIFLAPPGSRTGSVWNETCIHCHSVAGEPQLNPSSPPDSRVAELGIACESCHGPAAEHVRVNRSPVRRLGERLRGEPDPTIVNPARLSPERSAQVCGQCHGIGLHPVERRVEGSAYRAGEDLEATRETLVLSRVPEHRIAQLLERFPTYLEERFWPDGMVRVSGREYNGLVESPCFEGGELSCLSCHSMHESDPVDQLAAGMDGDEACLQCHEAHRDRPERHSHHAPGSPGSRCYDCHMPHTSYGLLKALRSHQVDSPDVSVNVATGRPNACNLCHLDRTLQWTADHLESWYGTAPPNLADDEKSVAAGVLWLLRGDAGQRALTAWSLGWEPARLASGEEWMAPFLAQALDDSHAAVRFLAHRSLTRLPGFEDFDYDYVGPPAERWMAKLRVTEAWTGGRAPATAVPRLLMGPDGTLDRDRAARLLKHRDERRVLLQE